jgi:hypothetical protein
MGATGLQGNTGLSGTNGATGLQGNTGLSGTSGATGLQGNTGLSGTNGATGLGLPGATGLRGVTGPAGVSGGGLIQFSTGVILVGATVVQAAPILMGFGSSAVELINGSGESTMPPNAAGFAFPIPFAGTISNLQVSADLLVASIAFLPTNILTYVFTVYVAPSSPNDGTAHVASPYVTSALTCSIAFNHNDITFVAGTFYASSNLNNSTPLVVNAGDRVGIRIRPADAASDAAAADITQLAFNATLSYTPS